MTIGQLKDMLDDYDDGDEVVVHDMFGHEVEPSPLDDGESPEGGRRIIL